MQRWRVGKFVYNMQDVPICVRCLRLMAAQVFTENLSIHGTQIRRYSCPCGELLYAVSGVTRIFLVIYLMPARPGRGRHDDDATYGDDAVSLCQRHPSSVRSRLPPCPGRQRHTAAAGEMSRSGQPLGMHLITTPRHGLRSSLPSHCVTGRKDHPRNSSSNSMNEYNRPCTHRHKFRINNISFN